MNRYVDIAFDCLPLRTITRLLVEQLEDMDPQWPRADFDVDAARKRLLSEEIVTAT